MSTIVTASSIVHSSEQGKITFIPFLEKNNESKDNKVLGRSRSIGEIPPCHPRQMFNAKDAVSRA